MRISDCSTKVTLSIVVPIGPNERSWHDLATDLASSPKSYEVIFVATEQLEKEDQETIIGLLGDHKVTWLHSRPGRAIQLNMGAGEAKSQFLWFLHADSRVNQDCLTAIEEARESGKNALFYFDLRFQRGGPRLIWLNTVGVWLRSHIFGLPFGDQGFALSKSVFDEVGGFSLGVPLGEDHHFVWEAKKRGVSISCVGADIYTSARKYSEQGWGRVTFFHLYQTLKQLAPHFRARR